MIDINELIKKQEIYWKEIEENQCTDPESIWYGGFNYVYTHEMAKVITQGLALYCEPESSYCKSKEILFRMKINSEYLLKYQNKSGLISLLDCNIESPPDTAFMLNDLAIAHFYIVKSGMDELREIDKNILEFMKRAKEGLLNGGFHTPNHRWVISSALGMLYKIFGDDSLKNRVLEYFKEGIDINEDGEWTERSNACYNAVTDQYMFHIGEIFGIEEAFTAIKKNLEMMKYLFHPDDYIATEYSTRQDKGKATTMNGRYMIVCMLIGGKYNIPEYVYMAERAMARAKEFGCLLLYARLYEEYILKSIESKPISDRYIKMINGGSTAKVPKAKSEFGDSVLRYRNEELSITVMAGQPDFLFLQYGKARMFGMRFVVGWFGRGGVSFPTVERLSEHKYRLSTISTGKYWQVLPYERVAESKGNFNKMPNNTRENIGKVEFFAECIIDLKEDGIELDVSVESEHFLFTQMVCMFDRAGKFECDDSEQMNEWVIRQNSGKSIYTQEGDVIEIVGDGNEHDFGVIRGDNLNKEAQNLVFNYISPRHRKIIIRHK